MEPEASLEATLVKEQAWVETSVQVALGHLVAGHDALIGAVRLPRKARGAPASDGSVGAGVSRRRLQWESSTHQTWGF